MTKQTTTLPTACTVVVSATGARCGRPAVHTFRSTITGETFGECRDHYHASPVSSSSLLGSEVEVRRHGRTYIGIVTRVGTRGAVYATVTYGNGSTREVRV